MFLMFLLLSTNVVSSHRTQAQEDATWTSIETPPPALNIDVADRLAARDPAKSSRPQAQAVPIEHHRYQTLPPPPPAPYGYHGYYPYPQQHHSPPRRHQSNRSNDSEDDPTLFDLTLDWLAKLDACPKRGSDGTNFSQYIQTLVHTAGYRRINQIAEEGLGAAQVLSNACVGLPLGTAKLLIKYATADCKAIRREASARRH